MNEFYYKNNRLNQIRGFCYTVQKGSTIEAAKFLKLTQPTITLQIRSLERDLKIKLFQNTRPLKLTAKGQKFYDMAVTPLRTIESLHETFFAEEQENRNNFLSIAGHHSVFTLILPKHLKKMQQANAKLKVHLAYLQKNEAIERLIDNKIDLAIYPLEEQFNKDIPNELEIIKIMPYKPVVLFPKNHALEKIKDKDITFADIGRDNNFIHTGEYAISDIMKREIEKNTLKSSTTFENGNWEMLKTLVSEGGGVTIFHEDYIKDDDDLSYKDISHLSPYMNYFALVRKGEYLKENVLKLINMLKGQEN